MTEAEWLACTDPTPMLEYLRGKARYRKLRLFVVGCCYREYGQSTVRPDFEVVEKLADGQTTLDEVRKHWLPPGSVNEFAWPERPFEWATYFVSSCPMSEEVEEKNPDGRYPVAMKVPPIISDVFGNPFRPVTIDPTMLTWNGGTVPKLAQVIYDERRFSDLPILADALEEVGCSEPAILTHCRSGGEHVRGCWVVDLLLGRE
jgi:hypothetical protein